MDEAKVSELEKIANGIRRDIVTQVYSANSGHPGGSLSIADVLTYLYFEKKVRFPLRKIPYIHYFLSWRQKAIVKTSIFQDKEEVMDKLVKFYKMP
mgnify:CR=1 FL=1